MILALKRDRRRNRKLVNAVGVRGLVGAVLVGRSSGSGGFVTPWHAACEIPISTESGRLARQSLAESRTMRIEARSSKLEAHADALLAQRLGEFEKEDLAVEAEFIPALEWLLLVARGKLDASGSAVNAGLLNRLRGGAGIRIVYPSQGSSKDQTDRGWYINAEAVNPDMG